jgi:hypothetical protein
MLWAARVLARAAGAVCEFLSRLRRRRRPADPAEQLRHKLAESRERAPEPASTGVEPAPEPALETAEKEPEPGSTELENLRRDVHTRARALSEEMRGANEGD